MPIKMIVCDMDGTLLNSENEIMPKTKKKLIELQAKGIRLVLASGRSYKRLLSYATELKMDQYNGYLIDVNGTSFYDMATHQRYRIASLEKEDIQTINEFFSMFNVELQYSQDEGVCTYLTDSIYDIKRMIRSEMKLPQDYPWMSGMYSWLADFRDGYPNMTLIRDLKDAPDTCNKMSVAQEPQYIEFIKDIVNKSDISKHYEFVASDHRKLEVTKKGVNKGNALNQLMDHLCINKDEVIVFGDSENDISMFLDKPYSIAMANSLITTKEQANYLTGGNNDEGIYHLLDKFEKEGIIL